MNRFVESFATRQLLPWVSKGCKTWGFAVRVGRKNTQGYLDTYFNGEYPDRAPYVYKRLPGRQFGFVTVSQHANTFSDVRGQGQEDTLSYWEVYWTFPARRYALTEGKPSPDSETVWVQPFSVCDNPMVMFGSREIWGADVMLAEIVSDDKPPANNLHLDIAVDGFRKFAPRSLGELLACMHVQMTGGGELTEDKLAGHSPDLTTFVQSIAGGKAPAESATPEMFVPGGTTGVSVQNYVKQIRDIDNWNDAIYRAIVASQTTRIVKNPVFYSGDKIELDFMWSATVAELYTDLLGIDEPKEEDGPPKAHEAKAVDGPPQDHTAGGGSPKIRWNLKRTPVKVELAYSFESDVTFAVTDTLHTYRRLGAAMRRRASALKSNGDQSTQSGQQSDAAQ